MNGAHEQNNLRFNDTSMSYRIGEFNKDSFVSDNSQTSGNFPGFKLNNQYRVYIGYFNAANVQLNQAGGQVEMSLHASPMIQASPPLVRPHKVCYVLVIYFWILNALRIFYRISDHVLLWIHRHLLATRSPFCHLVSEYSGTDLRA